MLKEVFKNRAVYELMWKIIVEPERTQMTIWRIRTACFIPKATNTLSEYIILIVYRMCERLHERASLLR